MAKYILFVSEIDVTLLFFYNLQLKTVRKTLHFTHTRTTDVIFFILAEFTTDLSDVLQIALGYIVLFFRI